VHGRAYSLLDELPKVDADAIPWLTVEQMREVDRLAIEEAGMLLEQMMENAGRSLGGVARRLLGGSTAATRASSCWSARRPARLVGRREAEPHRAPGACLAGGRDPREIRVLAGRWLTVLYEVLERSKRSGAHPIDLEPDEWLEQLAQHPSLQ
jgi:hypothetical protein